MRKWTEKMKCEDRESGERIMRQHREKLRVERNEWKMK